MLAWKFFAPGAIAPFTGIRWPAPEGSRSAPWVEGMASPGQGVHACAAEHLPYWFDEELWEVELDGPVTREVRQLIARRGRLVSRVDDWPACQPEFVRGCLERTRRRVGEALCAACCGRAWCDDAARSRRTARQGRVAPPRARRPPPPPFRREWRRCGRRDRLA